MKGDEIVLDCSKTTKEPIPDNINDPLGLDDSKPNNKTRKFIEKIWKQKRR